MEKSFPKKWVKNRNYTCSTSSSNSWRTLPRSIEPEDVKRLLRKRFNPRDKCMILMLLEPPGNWYYVAENERQSQS